MKKTCSVVICGDICPTPDTEASFLSGDAQGLFKGLLPLFHQADLLIGNLEFPLTDIGKGVAKCGPVLQGKKECLNVLQAAGFDVLGLANNHVRDCGDEGVLSTLDCCRNAGIKTVGAGENAAAAREPLIVTVEGWKIGIIAFAEHEFNAASETKAGANLLDLYYSFDQIQNIRIQCDYLIVLYHGGIEHYAYPSPMLQKKCRKMIESGADLVLCQHSHCVGTEEQYSGGTILYGQGNTSFGYRDNDQNWNLGLLVKVLLTDNSQHRVSIEYLPIAVDNAGVDLLSAKKAESFISKFLIRSQQVEDKSFVQSSWQDFCEQKQAHYLPLLLGLGRIVNFVNRKVHNRLVTLFYTKRQYLVTLNLVRCEAHHEVVETILKRAAKTE